MHVGYAFLATYSLSLVRRAGADGTFYLQDQWRGNDFLQGEDWNYWSEGDPTHGTVNYVGLSDAISQNMAYGTYVSALTVRVGPRRPPSQRMEMYSSCVPTIGPSLMHPRLDATACASLHRQHTPMKY